MLQGNVINQNKNTLISQNTGSRRLSIVIHKHQKGKQNLLWVRVVPGTKLFSEASLPSQGQKNILTFRPIVYLGGFVLEKSIVS